MTLFFYPLKSSIPFIVPFTEIFTLFRQRSRILQRHPLSACCLSDAPHCHQRARGQPPVCGSTLRLSVSVCGLARRVRWRKRHQCPLCALQRRPCALWMLCIAISGQEVSRLSAPACGRILRRCIRLRSAFGSIPEGSAINARFVSSSGVR